MATCLIHIPHLFPLFFSFPSLSPELPLLRIWPQPFSLFCCIAFARGHRETAENLCRYSRPFHRVWSQSTVSEKMTSRSAFRCAGRGPAHPNTDSAKSCLHDLGDRLIPGTYHTPNTVGQSLNLKFSKISGNPLWKIPKVKTTIWGLLNINSPCNHKTSPYHNFIFPPRNDVQNR